MSSKWISIQNILATEEEKEQKQKISNEQSNLQVDNQKDQADLKVDLTHDQGDLDQQSTQSLKDPVSKRPGLRDPVSKRPSLQKTQSMATLCLIGFKMN
jgi:hypothetical protein